LKRTSFLNESSKRLNNEWQDQIWNDETKKGTRGRLASPEGAKQGGKEELLHGARKGEGEKTQCKVV
jgi:hypothetical protein